MTSSTPGGFVSPEPIAIVGSGCRFPGGATSPSKLWELLRDPIDLGREISSDRFNTHGFYQRDGTRHGATNVRNAYLLDEDVSVFDAPFFGISPNEADSMDPQQRLLLETVYEALEAGGHRIEDMRGSDTSVYVGAMCVDYYDTITRDLNNIPTYFATGANRAILSNRISYFFDWHGPSMTIDTACSSSLVAVHQAVQALRSNETRVSLACGAHIILGPEMFIIESKLGMLSPTGRSRMWDAAADGYARGEGVAAVVLKRLSTALTDGDRIECLIRETGTNQDGFTNSLTVPNFEAQTTLIRQTYSKAGLDPENKAEDRPQYFEAHGTGTQAGDPREAAAVYEALGRFFHAADSTPLYVGSIKTVIGHSEGAAGLAGLLKASYSIQRCAIPPNLLFDRLNPKIAPFYKGVQIPTVLTPWPEVHSNSPRRASVNSFGFGGANAHIILEQYQSSISNPIVRQPNTQDTEPENVAPFIFSAATEASLEALLKQYSSLLKLQHHAINVSDLAWTVNSRRSRLPVKAVFAARNLTLLASEIDRRFAAKGESAGTVLDARSTKNSATPRVLGVFTGQGAQWPTMGAELIRISPFVRQRLKHMEDSLAALPASDRPAWNLTQEILKEADDSRMAEAALSQPLCTAIQIILVDLLRAAGIRPAAVVGHSSGEIAAAYSSGLISAYDAIRIAYYRGLTTLMILGDTDKQVGAMMAVGTSREDAEELINLRAFKGRLAIAAHNSSDNITLSGDNDAINHAKMVFDEEKKFARILRIEMAYHSHHMIPCGSPYAAALDACDICIVSNRDADCPWFSSVYPDLDEISFAGDLCGPYWRDNMLNQVFFADAVKNVISSDSQLNLVIEIGPHPALEGPTTQNIGDVRSKPLPYLSLLRRGTDDVNTFSHALGQINAIFGVEAVNLNSLERTLIGHPVHHELVSDLPSYQWNHERTYWAESRKSRVMRNRKQRPHELLGALSPNSNAYDMRWTNVLKLSEISWLQDHQLQGQVVFPAAGYIAMAIEACSIMADGRPCELIELEDFSIPKAITFDNGDVHGIETLLTLTSIERPTAETTTAKITIYATSNVSTGLQDEPNLVASGRARITFGESDIAALPCTPRMDRDMAVVDVDRFYANLVRLGYGYSGPFRSMTSMKRRLGHASALVDSYAYEDGESDYLVHPSWLDVSFQTAMLAYSTPSDKRLWSLHIPVSISSVRLNPKACDSLPMSTTKIPVCATLDEDTDVFSANIEIDCENGETSMIQVEDLVMKPFAPATEADDRQLFSYTDFQPAFIDGPAAASGCQPSIDVMQLGVLCERLSYYYLRKWKTELTDTEWDAGPAHFLHLRDFVNHTLSKVARGHHSTLNTEWANDTVEDIRHVIEGFSNVVDIRIIQAVGENIPAAVRGETKIIEHMMADGMLDEFYQYGLGMLQYNSFLGSMAKQLTHVHPHLRLLEIGAGTGGATKSVLEAVGDTISSYTFTDISVGFFQRATDAFHAYSDIITFKGLDIESPPAAQGFQLQSYDLIIASNVLHATTSLQKTLKNTRQLLKPGGYLMILEITDLEPVRCSTIMGGLPGWWLGVSDGRKYAPSATPSEWESRLREAGFGGIDAITPKLGESPAWPFSVIAAQAIDDRVAFLRNPLSTQSSVPTIEQLVVIGNYHLAIKVMGILQPFCNGVTFLEHLPMEATVTSLRPMVTFLNLADLDSPIFNDLTPERMSSMKRLFEMGKHILWITNGALSQEPYHMASLAFLRSITNEAPHANLNSLDVSNINNDSVPKTIAEQLLRQCALSQWNDESVLWSREPETFLHGEKLLVPRLKSDTQMDDRLNSLKRSIFKNIRVAESSFSISRSNGSILSLIEETRSGTNPDISLTVECSTLMAFRVASDAYLHVVCGKDSSAKRVCGLVFKQSKTTTPLVMVPLDTTSVADDLLLVGLQIELLAASITDQLPPDCAILLRWPGKHQPLSVALMRCVSKKGIKVFFVCDADSEAEVFCIRLNNRGSKRSIRRSISLAKPTHFLDLTGESGGMAARIIDCLPPDCIQLRLSDYCRPQASALRSFDHLVLATSLEEAVTAAEKSAASLTSKMMENTVFEVTMIWKNNVFGQTIAVLNWPTKGEIKVEIRPVDASSLFSKDKTYILFGLSGQIGQSLTEWMVSNGAGCVILTSRNPKVNQKWLNAFEETQSVVKTYSLDILDKQKLDLFLQEIRSSCPPIAGVANGAMILNDVLFDRMTFEQMQSCLQPKVEGTNNLDRAFHGEELDFFILFSSASCVVGNSGQANYAAANGYLNGIARQRRCRGLAASAIDIGLVAGIGYVENADQHVADQLIKYGMMPLSETDLRQAFAETILAGRVKTNDSIDFPTAVVTTGIRTLNVGETNVAWYDNPVFSHRILRARGTESDVDQANGEKMLPITEQIAQAANVEEAQEVLQTFFQSSLRDMLQISDQEIERDLPLVSLGIDSIMAVQARSWFLKKVRVDVPVLKMIGGATLAEVCEFAMKTLRKDLMNETKAKNSEETTLASYHVPDLPLAPGGQATSVETNGTTELSIKPIASSHQQDHDSTNEVEEQSKIVSKSMPMSLGQKRFWFLRFLVEDWTAFNVTFYHRLSGHVRVSDLERAIRIVTNRHEALRTHFVDRKGRAEQATQEILHNSLVRLECKKIHKAEEAAAEYDQLRQHIFSLDSGPLLRMLLLSMPNETHYLLVNYHHIIMDGLSYQNFILEVEQAYRGEALHPPPMQYPDFAIVQRQALADGTLIHELEYWRSIFPAGQLPPVLPLLPMTHATSRASLTRYDVHQVQIELDQSIVAGIKSTAKALHSTSFHFFLAAFKAMLFSFTDIHDLNIGIADANRNDINSMSSVGLFLNLLPLRFARQPQQRFSDAVCEARDTTYSALSNSRLPFDMLLKEFGVERSTTYSPLFQAFFDYRQTTRALRTICGCQFDMQASHPGRTAYDISVDVTDDITKSEVTLRVQSTLYSMSAANLLLQTYVHFLSTLSKDASCTLTDMPLFSEDQRAKAINLGRGPDMVTEWPATLLHRVDQIATERSLKVALIDGLDHTLTYSQMQDRIQIIAQSLLNVGVGRASRVLVYQAATTDWICSMLAIMRLGAVYVPLDLRNPPLRLAALAKDCQPAAVLTDLTTTADASSLDLAPTIDVSCVASQTRSRISISAKPDSLAAILYTSGSTGVPKGICVQHSGIRNNIEGYTKTYKLDAECVLQQSAFTFDFSMDQIFTGLVNGGMVIIVPYKERGDPLSIARIIRQRSITYTKATPSEYSLWLRYGYDDLKHATSWQFAFGGGEPFANTIVQQFHHLKLPKLALSNSYGPAEVSISSHKGPINYQKHTTMFANPAKCGWSLPNYATYILDPQMRPLPSSMPGEIYIGGAGVTLGYLNDSELTSSSFVTNPFATSEFQANGWTMMHRTGDVGHLRDDGSLVFRSRTAGDTQVKMRGLRFDLRDIEVNIVSVAAGALREAIVTLREGHPDYLVAHVVFASQHNIDDKEAFLENLLNHLQLPEYMIPVLAIPIDALPLNLHSKVDRKALKTLPLPRRATAVDSQGDPQLTETMVLLMRLWRDVLGKQGEEFAQYIVPSTNFFRIGGNSMLVVTLQSRILHTFGVAVRLVDLINSKNLSEMAQAVTDNARTQDNDWSQETALPMISHLSSPMERREGPKQILLTGATGNVARHLLPRLIESPDVAIIHCVAVRDQHDLVSSTKTVIYGGDLSSPNIGLSQDQFTTLSNEVDVILHLGASRSFWDTYSVLRPSNVHPVRELIKLAASRCIPIQMISSPKISTLQNCDAPPADGYLATKWVSERLLQHASEELGIPSTVHRFLPLVTDSSTSAYEVLDEFAHFVDLAGSLPHTENWEGRMDLCPAGQLVEILIEHLLTRRSKASSFAVVEHETSTAVNFSSIDMYLQQHRGDHGYNRVDPLKWMGRVKASGFPFVISSHEAALKDNKSGTRRIISR